MFIFLLTAPDHHHPDHHHPDHRHPVHSKKSSLRFLVGFCFILEFHRKPFTEFTELTKKHICIFTTLRSSNNSQIISLAAHHHNSKRSKSFFVREQTTFFTNQLCNLNYDFLHIFYILSNIYNSLLNAYTLQI